jgi:O-antigen/teichoic acid export membrane protein
LGEIENGGAYVILISILAITIGISSVYETSYSMQFKPFKACLINFVGIIFRILIVFYFVNFSVIDVEKIIKSQIVISLLILFVLFALNIKHFKAEIDWVILKPVLKFGTGLMLGSVSVWIITLIDRRFLAEYSGLEDVAVYSLASTIGMLITPVFLLPFRKIFTPFKLKVYNQAGARLKIQCFYEVYCFLGVFCVLGLSLYAKFFVWLLGTNDYSAAINIIPLIAISYFLWGLNEFYGLGLIIGNKSLINSGLVTITAILNIILNFMLIPSYGVMGAAFATIISYLLTNVLYFQFSKKYYDGQIKFLSWFKFIIVYVLIYVIYLSIEIEIITEFFVNILLAISYLLICYHFKLIKKEQFLRVKI